jgi:hypothetical protein
VALKSFILNAVPKHYTNTVHNFVRKWTLASAAYDASNRRSVRRSRSGSQIDRYFNDLGTPRHGLPPVAASRGATSPDVYNSPADTGPRRLSRPRKPSTGAASRAFSEGARAMPRNSSTGAHFA